MAMRDVISKVPDLFSRMSREKKDKGSKRDL
jgi:hypothetical protein